MNYLLDKKLRQRKFLKLSLALPALIILIYFHAGIFRGLSSLSHAVFRPIFIFGNNTGGKFSSIGSFFSSRKSLTLANEQLKSELDATSAKLANYNSLLDDNNQLKEILGRKKDSAPRVLAGILSKPNQSPYDTLVIDVGDSNGVKKGDTVFALGNIPIGHVEMVYGSSSKIILFSSPGYKTDVIVPGKNIFAEAIGRGGGNFEILLPRDVSLERGAEITLPGINSYVVGIMEAVISDPRDSFQRALLVSPVNIQEIKFVEVELQK